MFQMVFHRFVVNQDIIKIDNNKQSYEGPRPLQRKHVISCVQPVVDVAPMAGATPIGVAVFSRGVGVDGAGRVGAELDNEFLPTKVLEYVVERCPGTSHSALQANSNNWVMSAYSL
jgi:hypothetical protein